MRGRGAGGPSFCSPSLAQRPTFRFAMISIGSGLKSRASQRGRNTLPSDACYGAPANYSGEPQPPPPCGVGGRGGPSFCSPSLAQRPTFRFAMISIGSGLKSRASQRCRNTLPSDACYGAPANYSGEPQPPPTMRGRGAGGAILLLTFSGSKAHLSFRNDFNWQRLEIARIATRSQHIAF